MLQHVVSRKILAFKPVEGEDNIFHLELQEAPSVDFAFSLK